MPQARKGQDYSLNSSICLSQIFLLYTTVLSSVNSKGASGKTLCSGPRMTALVTLLQQEGNMVISYVCRGLILSGAGDTERKETASSSLGACISGETEGCTGGGLNQVGGVKGEGVRGRRVELLHFLAHSEIYPRTK
jgi:hypothetical protein